MNIFSVKKQKTEIEKLNEAIKAHSVCKPMHELKESNLNGGTNIWLNPHNQTCFNAGWFEYQDFYEWMQGTGKIVKGATPEEKKKFWDVAAFENSHDFGWAFGYNKKYFHLIDETYHPESEIGYINRYPKNPLKIRKDNHTQIIAKVFGDVCRYYADTHIEPKRETFYVTRMREELNGVKGTLFALGVGYYGASNTPCEPENLSWISDICFYKAMYLYYVKNNVELPDFDFVYNKHKE